jgi:hypothetical protein
MVINVSEELTVSVFRIDVTTRLQNLGYNNVNPLGSRRQPTIGGPATWSWTAANSLSP